MLGKARNIRAVYRNTASVKKVRARNGVEHGGFTGAVAADNSDKIPVVERKADAVQRDLFH